MAAAGRCFPHALAAYRRTDTFAVSNKIINGILGGLSESRRNNARRAALLAGENPSALRRLLHQTELQELLAVPRKPPCEAAAHLQRTQPRLPALTLSPGDGGHLIQRS